MSETEKEDPKLILVSDLSGCQEKHKNQYLTKLACKPQFFNSLNLFLNKNDKNKVAFVGNFFDKGSYVISTIMNIMALHGTHENRVHIILSYREISKMRFIFELDKALLRQGISKYPGKEGLAVKKAFVPIEKINDDEFESNDGKRYINSIYNRINDILTQTHDGKISYCLLIHESMMFAFKNARRQGYLELVIMLQELGSLILVYPFVADVFYKTFLYKKEVEYMIKYLVKNIKEYFNKYCKKDKRGQTRTDPLFKDLKKHLDSIYGILDEEKEDFDYIKSTKMPPLKYWEKVCMGFLSVGNIMTYDSDFSTLLCHDYALVDFFKVFKLSYSLVLREDDLGDMFEMIDTRDDFEASFTIYYNKLYYFYKLYDFCHKKCQGIDFTDKKEADKFKKEIREEIELEKMRIKREICEKKDVEESDVFLNFEQSFFEGDEKVKYHDFKIKEGECEKLKKKIKELEAKLKGESNEENTDVNSDSKSNPPPEDNSPTDAENPPPAAGNLQPATGNPPPPAGNPPPAAGNPPPAGNPPTEEDNVQAPGAENPPPGTENPPPAAGNTPPAAGNTPPAGNPPTEEDNVQAPEIGIGGNTTEQSGIPPPLEDNTTQLGGSNPDENFQIGSKKNQKGGFQLAGMFFDKQFEEIDLSEHMGMNGFFGLNDFILFSNEMTKFILNWDIENMDQSQMNMFLFLHAFYLHIFNNPRTFLDENVLRQENDIIEFLIAQGVKCIVSGTVESGAPFPICLEHSAGTIDEQKEIILVAPNISKFINERTFTSLDFTDDLDDDEIKKYTLFRQRAYPLAVLSGRDSDMECVITSLKKNGNLDNKHTYIGEYMAHTFSNHFLSHDYLNIDGSEITGKAPSNEYLETNKLTAKMLPVFDNKLDVYDESTFFIGNMLFIRLKSVSESSFLILYFDFKKRKKDESRVYYYFGDIASWNCYFWDSYQRKISMYQLTYDEKERLNVDYLTMVQLGRIEPPHVGSKFDLTTGSIIEHGPSDKEKKKTNQDQEEESNERTVEDGENEEQKVPQFEKKKPKQEKPESKKKKKNKNKKEKGKKKKKSKKKKKGGGSFTIRKLKGGFTSRTKKLNTNLI